MEGARAVPARKGGAGMDSLRGDGGRIDAVAVVLAGGRSTRYGRDKRLERIDGETLLARGVRLMGELFPRVAVSANDRPDGLPAEVELVRDLVAEAGPLGGIHAALVATGAERIFVHACDIPYPSFELIRRLDAAGAAADVALCETSTGLEPLHAFYRRACLPAIRELLAAGGRKVIDFYDRVSVAKFRTADHPDIPGLATALLNVNRAGDLERARSFAAGGRVA